VAVGQLQCQQFVQQFPTDLLRRVAQVMLQARLLAGLPGRLEAQADRVHLPQLRR
jgi:hypothetical protein